MKIAILYGTISQLFVFPVPVIILKLKYFVFWAMSTLTVFRKRSVYLMLLQISLKTQHIQKFLQQSGNIQIQHKTLKYLGNEAGSPDHE